MAGEAHARQSCSRSDVDALVTAVQHARWYFHCEAMRDRENDPEGPEIAIETGLELARAVLPFDPDTPACKGCSHGPNVWAWSARDLIADYEKKTKERGR